MKIINVKVLSKKVTITTNDGKSKKFIRYFAPCHIVVKGHEEEGKVKKSVEVRFTQEIAKKLPKDFRFGIFNCDIDENQISIPTKWEVKKNEETGKLEYPVLWIRGFVGLKEIKPKIDLSTVSFDSDLDDLEETDIEVTEDDEVK